MIAKAIYLLCAITSLIVAALLYRQSRSRTSPLLFWSFVGFFGLALNSVLVFIDLAVLPAVDLSIPRTLAGTFGMTALLYGLIRNSDR